MDFEIIPPSPRISSYISHYWHFSCHFSDHHRCEAMSSDAFQPSGCVNMMFNRNHPTLFDFDHQSYFPQAFVFGQKMNPTMCGPMDEMDILCVVLQTAAAGLLFSFPIVELFNRAVDINDMDDEEMRVMAQRVCEASSVRESIFIFECFVEQRLAKADFFHLPHLSAAISGIYMNPSLRIQDISRIACLGDRQLLRVFESTVGLSPKQFERIAKLKRMFYMLNNSARESSYVRMALAAGYYDQAHMNHEFRELTSFSPKEFSCKLEKGDQFYTAYLSKTINIGKRIILGE